MCADTHFVFFPFNLDFIAAISIPEGSGASTFPESTPDIVSSFLVDGEKVGGISGRSSVWCEEPGKIDDDTVPIVMLLPFATEGSSSSSASVSLEPPTFSGEILKE